MLCYQGEFEAGGWEESSRIFVLSAYECYTIGMERTQYPSTILEQLRIITE